MIFTNRQLNFIQKAFHFTPRQMDVIKCVSKGLDNEKICEKMGISYNTLTSHLWTICNKLGAKRKFGILAVLIELVQKNKI